MSYIYSLALVEAFSEANCSDTDASALLNENPMLKPSWWHDKTMEPSLHSRFGMTYAPLTESLGAELLTWFVADSLAKTYQFPETGPDWTAKGQGYGEKWRGLLAKYNPDTHSLKTAQLSLLEDLTGCCATLPRWGLMLDGELYPQPMLVPITSERESGYWPTPTATDYKGSPGEKRLKERMAESCRGVRLPEELARRGDVGQLNPDWVEWLMGWPIGQTALKPLETGKLAEWQQQHSPCYMVNKESA